MDVISMDWRHVLVASWPVDPDVVAATLPPALDPDTHDGHAYLSVVPFLMADVRPRGVPRALAPTFAELNLRTYVTADGDDPGVYFYNLDATDRLGVAIARLVYDLPYYNAHARVVKRDDAIDFASDRDHPGVPDCSFDATYEPTDAPTTADPGTLDAFLMERYRFYVGGDDGPLRYGPVDHPSWRVAPARVAFRENDLFAVNDFDHPGGDPHALYSHGVPVTAGLPERY